MMSLTLASSIEPQAAQEAETKRPPVPRTLALDALRGLAILMMVFSGIIPFDQPLPRWMYHAQEPPVYDATHQITHQFNPHRPGLTWVDLVFPFFLFALGAAIPLALGGRLTRGMRAGEVVRIMGQRLLALGWFAIYFQHIRSYTIQDSPNLKTWVAALLGFALLFPMYTRLPKSWSVVRYWTVRGIGFLGAAALLAWLSPRHYPDGTGFRLDRSDIILIVLANVACFGTGLWWVTRQNLMLRLGALALLLAFRLSSGPDGWVHDFWNGSLAPWLFQWDYLKYLFIVVPGTIAGDLLWEWQQSRSRETEINPADKRRLAWFIVIAQAVIVVTLAGLEARRLGLTTLAALALGAAALGLVSGLRQGVGGLIRTLTQWGLFWLALGLVCEPYEGGIHKDPSTLSYYFVTSGLALFLLCGLIVLMDVFGRRRGFALLADAGQNPMIAYVAMENVFWPLFAFVQPLYDRTHWGSLLDRLLPTPWLGVGYGALETLLLAFFVRFFTRRQIFWRT